MQKQKLSDKEVGSLLRTINNLCAVVAPHISSKADYNCQLAIQDLVESEYLEHIINQYEPDFPAGHLPNGLTDGVDWVADTEVCQALADYYDNTDPINRPSQKNNGQFNDRS